MNNFSMPGMPQYTDEEIDEMLDFFGQQVREDEEEEVQQQKAQKKEKFVDCECGADKTYGKNVLHVDWCPKYGEIK